MAVSAQQTQEKEHRQRPTGTQQKSAFDDLDLNSEQKKLLKERHPQMQKNQGLVGKKNQRQEQTRSKMHQERNQFDARVQQILTKEQYAKFKATHQKKRGDKRPDMNKSSPKSKQPRKQG